MKEIIVFFISFGFIFFGIGMFIYYSNFRKKALIIKGKIVDFKVGKIKNQNTFSPIISYKDPVLNKETTLISNIGWPTNQSLGKTIDVYWMKNKGGEVKVVDNTTLHYMPAISLLFGIFLLVIAILSTYQII